MKYIIIMIMILYCSNLFGQMNNEYDVNSIVTYFDKMGLDNSPFLNSYESAYLNEIFKDSRIGFDFQQKKIGFIRNGGKGKILYFDMHKKHVVDKKSSCDNGILYCFNALQKKESGGYDAVIVYWTKRVIPINDLVKRLKDTD